MKTKARVEIKRVGIRLFDVRSYYLLICSKLHIRIYCPAVAEYATETAGCTRIIIIPI